MSVRPLLLCALAALLTVPALATPAVGAPFLPIQPGASHSGFCTLNFVFDGVGHLEGHVFIGTAGHCVDELGETASTDGHPEFGRVVYMWGSRSDLDFALIEVHSSHHEHVVPEVRGHPGMPTGHTTEDRTTTGDLVLFSGHGMGYRLTQPTREMRAGVLVNDDAREYGVEGPILWGDSGGPVLHQNGEALGIVSRLGGGSCTGCEATWLVGPTVDGLLAELAAKGWPVKLRLAS